MDCRSTRVAVLDYGSRWAIERTFYGPCKSTADSEPLILKHTNGHELGPPPGILAAWLAMSGIICLIRLGCFERTKAQIH